MLAFAYLATCALGHMGVTPSSIKAEGREVFEFMISHTCPDAAGTSNFTIVIPEGLFGITIHQNRMWYNIFHKVPVEPPVKIGKTMYNETIRSVEYHGFLPENYYETFGLKALAMMMPNGTKLYWKGYQTCPGSLEPVAWAEIPDAANPAPSHPAVPVEIFGGSTESPTMPLDTAPTSAAGGTAAGTDAATMPATEAATMPVTEAVTMPATEAATMPATEAATMPATEAATMPVTGAAGMPATEAATIPATEAVTVPATTSATSTEHVHAAGDTSHAQDGHAHTHTH
jgi:Domain of unkown function (DUF1775)